MNADTNVIVSDEVDAVDAHLTDVHLTTETRSGECPLRGIARSVPAQHVKKSLLTIYMTVMLDVFSHSSWNGW